MENWLKNWIEETTQDDLEDLERFKYEKRVHQKYKEGDIFTFKIGRRQYGFGKILIDVAKRRKTEEFKQNKNYGLANLMGPALIVKVYHKISDNINADIDELERGLSLPPQAVMDNRIYYGEYKIIGNRKVTNRDLDDAPISTSKSINYQDRDIVYLQYGLIYRELSLLNMKRTMMRIGATKTTGMKALVFPWIWMHCRNASMHIPTNPITAAMPGES